MEKPQNIYDNEKFYNDYISLRKNIVNANDLLEIPIMKEMLPDLKGKSVLDLGCGYGEMSKYFVDMGAKRVVACDISENMLGLANKVNSNEKIEYKLLAMEELNNLDEKFDLIFSSLAFHYIEDFNKLIQDISNHLNENGILLFSQEHPITTCTKHLDKEAKKLVINGKKFHLLSDYNVVGKRESNWNVEGVIKYHRNFKTTLNTIINNGLEILAIDESWARKEAVEVSEKYYNQNDKPYFLFVKAKKK